MAAQCLYCKKSPPEVVLKHCAKCSLSVYCSRKCQRADWKTHKLTCGKTVYYSPIERESAGRLSPSRGLESSFSDPFTRLDRGTWLHDRPEADVFRLLIDAYRLRVEDRYNFDGEVEPNSIYDAESPNVLQGFRHFVERVAARPGLLPPWWNDDKRASCETLGMTSGHWHYLGRAITKGEIMEYYGDHLFPMQLRMLAEAVYGSGVGWSDSTAMRRDRMEVEQGKREGGYITTLDFSSVFSRH